MQFQLNSFSDLSIKLSEARDEAYQAPTEDHLTKSGQSLHDKIQGLVRELFVDVSPECMEAANEILDSDSADITPGEAIRVYEDMNAVIADFVS